MSCGPSLQKHKMRDSCKVLQLLNTFTNTTTTTTTTTSTTTTTTTPTTTTSPPPPPHGHPNLSANYYQLLPYTTSNYPMATTTLL